MKVGFIGLGKMGSRMVLKLLSEGHEVVVWNRSQQPIDGLRSKKGNLIIAKDIQDLVNSLESTKIVWSMVPAGPTTQDILDEISKHIAKDDIVIDGGNSHFKDTEKRYQEFVQKNIKFLGIGVSGGVIAATEGYPLMAGGDKSAYDFIKPILDSLSKPKGGHEYFGTGGAGHFVKMMHNAIEYGYMQSIGEGFDVLKNAPYEFDLVKVAKLYQKNTLLSGFMMDRTVEALEKHPNMDGVNGIIAAGGEAKWAIDQAKEENVEVEIIDESLEYRIKSQTDPKIQKSFTAKLVAALRQAFGGHELKDSR